jgi:hypothetical protein
MVKLKVKPLTNMEYNVLLVALDHMYEHLLVVSEYEDSGNNRDRMYALECLREKLNPPS